MLNAREPKIVNGPQILDKYVGESEANVRKLFADAEEEEKRVKTFGKFSFRNREKFITFRVFFFSWDRTAVYTSSFSMKSMQFANLGVLWFVETKKKAFDQSLFFSFSLGKWCWCSRYRRQSIIIENRWCRSIEQYSCDWNDESS